ncbi:hypothetical protein GEMRC1_001530 [Eukaryota sp. GEM-RC1]
MSGLALHPELQSWIEQTLGISFSDSWVNDCRNGQILCQLINKLSPGCIKRVHKSSMTFMALENIQNFVKGCHSLGVDPSVLFEPSDLFEAKNLRNVTQSTLKIAPVKTPLQSASQVKRPISPSPISPPTTPPLNPPSSPTFDVSMTITCPSTSSLKIVGSLDSLGHDSLDKGLDVSSRGGDVFETVLDGVQEDFSFNFYYGDTKFLVKESRPPRRIKIDWLSQDAIANFKYSVCKSSSVVKIMFEDGVESVLIEDVSTGTDVLIVSDDLSLRVESNSTIDKDFLIKNLDKVTVLDLSAAHLSEYHVSELIKLFPNLETLNLTNSECCSLVDCFPTSSTTIKNLILDNTQNILNFESTLHIFPKLESLSLQGCSFVTSSAINLIPSLLSQLTSIDLSNTSLTPVDHEALSSRIPFTCFKANNTGLKSSCLHSLSDISCKSLIDLDLSSTCVTSLVGLSKFENLKVLDISGLDVFVDSSTPPIFFSFCLEKFNFLKTKLPDHFLAEILKAASSTLQSINFDWKLGPLSSRALLSCCLIDSEHYLHLLDGDVLNHQQQSEEIVDFESNYDTDDEISVELDNLKLNSIAEISELYMTSFEIPDLDVASYFWHQLFRKSANVTYILTQCFATLTGLLSGCTANEVLKNVADQKNLKKVKLEDLNEQKYLIASKMISSIIYIQLFCNFLNHDPVLIQVSQNLSKITSLTPYSATLSFIKQLQTYGLVALVNRIVISCISSFPSHTLDSVSSFSLDYLSLLVLTLILTHNVPVESMLDNTVTSPGSLMSSTLISTVHHPLLLTPCSLPTSINPLIDVNCTTINSRAVVLSFLTFYSSYLGIGIDESLYQGFENLKFKICRPISKLVSLVVKLLNKELSSPGYVYFRQLTKTFPDLASISKCSDKITEPFYFIFEPSHHCFSVIFTLISSYQGGHKSEMASRLVDSLINRISVSFDLKWSKKAQKELQVSKVHQILSAFYFENTISKSKAVEELKSLGFSKKSRHCQRVSDPLPLPPITLMECSSFETDLIDHATFLSYNQTNSNKIIITGTDSSLSRFCTSLFSSDMLNCQLYYFPSQMNIANSSCSFYLSQYLASVDPIYMHLVFLPFLSFSSLAPTTILFPCYSSAEVLKSSTNLRSNFPTPVSCLDLYTSMYLYFASYELLLPLWEVEIVSRNGASKKVISCCFVDIGCAANARSTIIHNNSVIFDSPEFSVKKVRTLRDFDHSVINCSINYSMVNPIGEQVKNCHYSGNVYALSVSNFECTGTTLDLQPFDSLAPVWAKLQDTFLTFFNVDVESRSF